MGRIHLALGKDRGQQWSRLVKAESDLMLRSMSLGDRSARRLPCWSQSQSAVPPVGSHRAIPENRNGERPAAVGARIRRADILVVAWPSKPVKRVRFPRPAPQHADVAQSIEQRTRNALVAGLSPAVSTKFPPLADPIGLTPPASAVTRTGHRLSIEAPAGWRDLFGERYEQ